MPPQHSIAELREIEHGLGLLAAEVENHLETKPVNLLYWRRGLLEVIAELEAARWEPAAGTQRSAVPPAHRSEPRKDRP